MIISKKMQYGMDRQILNFPVITVAELLPLFLAAGYGEHHISQQDLSGFRIPLTLCGIKMPGNEIVHGKRQHIGRPVQSPEFPVDPADPFIISEKHGQDAVFRHSLSLQCRFGSLANQRDGIGMSQPGYFPCKDQIQCHVFFFPPEGFFPVPETGPSYFS